MNSFLSFFMATLFFISCKNPSINVEKQEAALYSFLIDEMATPFPPPPPPPQDGSKHEPINRDSINQVKVEVVVDTLMFQTSQTVDIDQEFSKYQKLVDSIPSLAAKPVKKEYLNSEKGHSLIFGNSLEDSNSQYSQMIGISRIAFNEEKTMAALYAGQTTHPLSGFVNLYLLKKTKGVWEIVFKKRVEVS